MKQILLATFSILAFSLSAQIAFDGSNVVVDFDNTLTGVNEGTFVGSGFDSGPAAGQLDSDAFAVTGFSDGDLTFGGSRTTGDYARGISTDDESTGGLYASTEIATLLNGATSSGSRLFVQPSGSDFTPGTVTLLANNTSGSPITTITIGADICFRNDVATRNTSITLSSSTDGMNFTPLAAQTTDDLTAAVTALLVAGGGAFDPGTLYCVALSVPTAVNIPAGGQFFLQISSDDVPGGSGSRDEIAVDNLTFSNFVLPVNLQSFSGHSEGGFNYLTWTTATELNNDHFNVQRSLDAKNWQTIGQVAGNGTTEERITYEFLDREAPAGLNYYRLQQVDYDGAFEYFGPITVRTAAASGVSVFPNPVKEVLNVQVQAPATIVIRDMNGRELVTYAIDGGDYHTVNTADWVAGTYLVSIRSQHGVTTERVVKH